MKHYQRNEKALNAEREKDAAAAEKSGESNTSFYNFKNGRTVLRVLGPYSNEGLWFREIHEYYFRQGGNHIFLTSPADFNLADPLNDYGRKMYEDGSSAALEEAKRFRAKPRYLLNVIVLSDAAGKTTMLDGVKVLKAPTTVKRAFVDFDTDVEYGDITNHANGFNMIVERTGEGLGTEYKVKAQRERTSIDEILAKGGIDGTSLNLYDLDKIHEQGLKTEAELELFLEQLRDPRFRVGESVAVTQESPTVESAQLSGVPATQEARAGGPIMTSSVEMDMPDLGGLSAPPSTEGDNE